MKGLDEVVLEVARNKPLLGVCVGMQALMEHSAENDGTDCLAIMPGRLINFNTAFVIIPNVPSEPTIN